MCVCVCRGWDINLQHGRDGGNVFTWLVGSCVACHFGVLSSSAEAQAANSMHNAAPSTDCKV